MCTVSVKVNEALLRGMRPELPELNSTAAIRQWAQQQIDLRIQQMELDDQETMTVEEAREMTLRAVNREYALDRDMTPEQLYAVISEEIDDISSSLAHLVRYSLFIRMWRRNTVIRMIKTILNVTCRTRFSPSFASRTDSSVASRPSPNGQDITWLIPISGTSPTRSKATPSR